MARDPDSVDAEIDSLKVNLEQLAARVRHLEKQIDTLGSPWWKRLWWRIDGWPPWYKVASRKKWRPWHWLTG